MQDPALRKDRIHGGHSPDQREEFSRDRDRLLYCEGLQRLSGVTQVARAGESYLHHDRMTHSLKVAQVGRRLAEYILQQYQEGELQIEGQDVDPLNGRSLSDYLSPAVVETAALAHDIGHPPFGHIAEEELDEKIRGKNVYEGFEGNAQSFRYVNHVGTHRNDYRGLNLTRATLNAILKYPSNRPEEGVYEKWGYYKSEEDCFEFARELTPNTDYRSLEAEIMDWADDVTYAIHDVADFYESGLLPLDQIIEDTYERDKFLDYFYDSVSLSPDDWDANVFIDGGLNMMVGGPALRTPYSGTHEDIASLNRLSSNLVERYIGRGTKAVGLKQNEDGYLTLDVNSQFSREVKMLKYLTKFYVIESSNLVSQQHGHREIISKLYKVLVNQAQPDGEHRNLIYSPFRERVEDLDESWTETERVRIVVDMISSMTEKQCLEMYKRITGHSSGSLLNQIMN